MRFESARLLRGLSLFHVALPVVLVWALTQLGYDRRALLVQTILGTIVLILSDLLTDPAENTNWVFGPAEPQDPAADLPGDGHRGLPAGHLLADPPRAREAVPAGPVKHDTRLTGNRDPAGYQCW